jgi:hypothetical protein
MIQQRGKVRIILAANQAAAQLCRLRGHRPKREPPRHARYGGRRGCGARLVKDAQKGRWLIRSEQAAGIARLPDLLRKEET